MGADEAEVNNYTPWVEDAQGVFAPVLLLTMCGKGLYNLRSRFAGRIWSACESL